MSRSLCVCLICLLYSFSFATPKANAEDDDPLDSGDRLVVAENKIIFSRNQRDIYTLKLESDNKPVIANVLNPEEIKNDLVVDIALSKNKLLVLMPHSLLIYGLNEENKYVLQKMYDDIRKEPDFSSLKIKDDILYITDHNFGVILLNISDASKAREIASFKLNGADLPVTIYKDYIIASDSEGLKILKREGNTIKLAKLIRLEDTKSDMDEAIHKVSGIYNDLRYGASCGCESVFSDFRCLATNAGLICANNAYMFVMKDEPTKGLVVKKRLKLPKPWWYTGEEITLVELAPGRVLLLNGANSKAIYIQTYGDGNARIVSVINDVIIRDAEAVGKQLYATDYDNIFAVYNVVWPKELKLQYSLRSDMKNLSESPAGNTENRSN